MKDSPTRRFTQKKKIFSRELQVNRIGFCYLQFNLG